MNVNRYLNLDRNNNVIEKAIHALYKFGTSASSCGMTSLHKEIEWKISELTGK